VIGLGIIGCGWAAGEIVRAAAGLRDVQIAAAFDPDAERASALATKAGATPVGSLDALLSARGVDAVYVGVPHSLLSPTVEKALHAGKHVLSEKPLALDPTEAARLGALADVVHRKLAVFFELRRAGTVSAARELVQSGRIGAPRLIRLRTLIDKRLDYWGPPDRLNWRARRAMAGGGVVIMNTIHQLDAVRYITGLDFASVSGAIATMAAPAGVDVEDAASATFTLSNGGLLNLVATAHSPGAEHEETIQIDAAAGRLDLPDPFGSAPLRLYERAAGWREIAIERADSHRAMLEAFLDSIHEDSPVPAGAADAAAALAAVTGLYRSAAEWRLIELR
jgi:UDP-N-acetyl-2-amino-2-deoxyglucuronate dehydrogenase